MFLLVIAIIYTPGAIDEFIQTIKLCQSLTKDEIKKEFKDYLVSIIKQGSILSSSFLAKLRAVNVLTDKEVEDLISNNTKEIGESK